MQDRDESCCVVPTSMLHWGFTSGVGMVLYKDSKSGVLWLPTVPGSEETHFSLSPGQSSAGRVSGSCGFYLRYPSFACVIFT